MNFKDIIQDNFRLVIVVKAVDKWITRIQHKVFFIFYTLTVTNVINMS